MTQPVTSANVPTAILQGLKAKPTPAKHATAHRVAAAKTSTANRGSKR